MADLIQSIANRYTNFCISGDGVAEINALSYLGFEAGYAAPEPDARLVLVLVEPRLLDVAGAPLHTELMRALRRFKGDLRAEGLHSRFLLANLYRGPIHKDGAIVLALRRFLVEVRATFAKLEGVVLVGNFPESSLVRRVSWSPGAPPRLAIGTELISSRADIVLSDLTGNWQAVYRMGDFANEDIDAVPDAATTAAGWCDGEKVRNCDFSSTSFQAVTRTYRDAFFLDDSNHTILERVDRAPQRLRVRLRQPERNLEVAADDRTLPNVLARPDITVSRINALRVAVNPNPSLVGTDGSRFLSAAGDPQVVASASPLFNHPAQHVSLFNHRSFDLERRLLLDYFERNHRFRVGAFSHLPFRGGVVSGTTDFSPDYYEPLVNAAASDLGPCVKVANADLAQYVAFHKTPAVLKYIIAHSSPWNSEFRAADPARVTAEVGGAPTRWVHENGRYVPSFTGVGGIADVFVHRAMWHRGTLREAGASLVVHGGCDVNSVAETQSGTYTTTNYAHWNNAEGLLFFTNCVALMSRAKGFNDSPWGFFEGFRLADRANFGSCMKSYYNAQANDAGVSTYNIQRKRAYFWSINGDWTLRLRNRNGLGLLALDGRLKSVDVHPNRAWIEGWNFDAGLNRVRGVGDLDGDGADEMVVTSEWGIGVLKYDGLQFRALMTAPRDTWFGGWRYDATVNPGRDVIKDVQNFTGNARREVMVWSSWGIATLELSGTSLAPSRLHANGTRLGGWVLSTADNVYCGSGQFDGDGRRDVLLVSPWGLGTISLETGASVYMAANGTRFGGWAFNSRDNKIRLIADLDGDGFDEIVISSPWGVGVLKLVGGALTSVAMHANGDNVDGHAIRDANVIALADKLRGGQAQQLLVTDAAGIHVLALGSGRLQRVGFVANGTRVDGWVVDTSNNRFASAGDMNGDGRAEWVVRSPWGVGVMGLDAGGQIRTYSMFPYGAVLGDWHLQPADEIVGRGNLVAQDGRSELVIVKP